jgi:hypothetical protein
MILLFLILVSYYLRFLPSAFGSLYTKRPLILILEFKCYFQYFIIDYNWNHWHGGTDKYCPNFLVVYVLVIDYRVL